MVGRPSPTGPRFDAARLLARILCAVFGLVGVLPLAAGLFVELDRVQRWAAAETARVLKEQLGVEASFGVRVHLVPLGLRVEHLVVPASDGGTPALSVERLSVTPRVFSLLAGRLDIGDVEIESPRARLVIEKGELKNVRYRLPKTQAKKAKTTSTPFGTISINDGRFTVDLDGTRIDTGTVDLDVFAEAGPIFELMLSGSGATITRSRTPMGSGIPPDAAKVHDADALCRLELRARFEAGELLIRRFSVLGVADLDPEPGAAPSCEIGTNSVGRVALRLSQVRASLGGEGKKPYLSGHIVARTPLALLNRFAKTLPLAGWAGFSGDVRYDGHSRLPEVHGRISGGGIAFGIYRLASELGVDLSISRDIVRIPRYEMVFADGHVLAQNARIEPFAQGTPLSVERVDGKGMTFEGLMRDLGVTPDTIIRWALVGTHVTNVKATLSPLKIDADLAAETRDFEVFDRAFHDPARRHVIGVKNAVLRGKIGVRPEALLFTDTRTDFGHSNLFVKLVSVGFGGENLLEVLPSKLDLADITPLLDIPMAGVAEIDCKMSGPGGDPTLVGNMSVKNLDFGKFPLGDIKSSKFKFRPLWVEISDAQARKGSSDFTVPTARIDFGTRASLLVEARAKSESLDLRDFFAMWHFDEDPRFDPIRGRTGLDTSLRYILGGPEDRCGGGALRIAGKLKAHHLDIFDERYDGGESSFDFLWHDRDATYRGIVLSVPDMVLRKGKGVISGKLNVQTGAKVSGTAALLGVPLAKLDALPNTLRAAEGTINASAVVSGTIDALELSASGAISPVKFGRVTLPGSTFRTELQPIKRNETPVGTTRCGQPISGPFDRAEYERDLALGVFHTSGEFFGGQITTNDVSVTRQSKKFVHGDVSLHDVDFGALLELRPEIALTGVPVNGHVTGTISIDELAMNDPASARGSLTLKKLALDRAGYRAELLPGADPLALNARKLSVPKAAFAITTPRGVKATIDVAAAVERLGTSPNVDATIDVRPTPLAGLVGLMPRVERADGSVAGHVRLTGALAAPRVLGNFGVERGELALRGLPTTISNIDLALGFADGELSVTRGSARIGSGTVQLSGGAPLNGLELGEARIRAVAHEVALPMKDGVRATADADLTIVWKPPSSDGEHNLPRVTGNALLRSFEYRRPVTIAADLNALAQRGKRTEFEAYDPSEEAVEFDILVRAQRSLRIQNDIVDTELVLSEDGLELAGTNARFGLRGALKLKAGGHVFLRRSDFEIREGSVRFDDLTRIAPRVDVTAVTEYRRYTSSLGSTGGAAASGSGVTGGRWSIRMHAHGDADNLHVDLTSDPALPQDDIFLLLTVGLTRAELDQAQSASVGGSVALEALGTLTGADRAVKNAVPIIDEFRFGSAYSSRTGRTEPTVTVGKRLTDRVRANVTSGLAESREVRSNVEWRLSPRVSVEGSYDNVNDISSSSLGNLGADVRWRLEFE